MGVHHVGPPTAEPGRQLHQMVVRRGHARHEPVVGQPGLIRDRPEHTHAVDHDVSRRVVVGEGEHDDLVARSHERRRKPVDMWGDAADDQRRVLPRDHGDAHRARRYGSYPAASTATAISTSGSAVASAGTSRPFTWLGEAPVASRSACTAAR